LTESTLALINFLIEVIRKYTTKNSIGGLISLTCPLTESTLALINFLIAAILTAREVPDNLFRASWNLTESPFCRKSRLSARLVIPYGYTSGSVSSVNKIIYGFPFYILSVKGHTAQKIP